MTDFTASNGVQIRIEDNGDMDFNPPNASGVGHLGWMGLAGGYVLVALREFFRAEEDERLGRWRWPEKPEYVMYSSTFGDGSRAVRIIRESDGATGLWPDPAPGDDLGDPEFAAAARAFFAALPEPKPWHHAKPGEVWLVEGYPRAVVERAHESHTFADPFGRNPGFPVDSPEIRTATRLWPEVSS